MNKEYFHEALFHATPVWNVANIIRVGIDPRLSCGELPVSWYCGEEKVEWSVRHVSSRYSVIVEEVVVFEVVEVPKAFFFISPHVDVFRTTKLLRPCAMYPSYKWFPAILENRS